MMTGKYRVVLALACGLMVQGCSGDEQVGAKRAAELGTPGRVRYSYDALGRLIQAAAADGTGVQYSYDPVGNITAIRRLAADALSLVDFAPHTGSIGSPVTIYGSGFDPVVGNNAVTFNGTAATINGATATTLSVIVPIGATSGKIAVANAQGNAISAIDYVINGVSSVPAISSFSPHLGPIGTIVTLLGSNFQSNSRDDRVLIGGQLSEVVGDATSPTSALLNVGVPNSAASGPIEVTTPFGVAVTSDEFFTLPVTVSPASVEFTGRLVVGGPALTITTTAGGNQAALVFDGHVGQQLHLVSTNGTFATGLTATVYAPSGVRVEALPLGNNLAQDFAQPLAFNGTHIIISPSASDQGSVRLSLVADPPPASIPLDGSTTVTLNPGQNARLSFTAQANTEYGLALTGVTLVPTTGAVTVTLRKVDGSSLTSCAFNTGDSCDFDPSLFAVTGTYLLDFDPGGLTAASFNAMVTTDVTGTVAIDAAPVAVTVTEPGQNARYTFSGTAGQLVTLVVTGGTYDDGNSATISNTQVIMTAQDGTFVGGNTFNLAIPGVTLDQTLPSTGTYTVLFKVAGLNTGTSNLQVKSYATGTLTMNSSTPVNLSAGQNARFNFTAQAGAEYGLAIAALTFTPNTGPPTPSLTVTLRKSDGTSLGSCAFVSNTSCDLDRSLFATTGTYLLEFNPVGFSATSFNVDVTADVTGTVSIDADPIAVPVSQPGQNATYTFSGTAGQLVSVVVTGATFDDGDPSTPTSTVVLLGAPNGTTLTGNSLNAVVTGLTLDQLLPATGTYTIMFQLGGLDTGTANLQVRSYATGALAVDGSTPMNLSAGQNGRFSFTAQAGTGYGLAITGLAFTPSTGTPALGMAVTLRKADGTSLTTCQFGASGSCDLDPVNFATTGTYLMDFDPARVNAASFTAILSTNVSGVIAIDDPSTTVAIVRPGQNARYTFSGTAGQAVAVVVNGYALDDNDPSTPPSTAAVAVITPDGVTQLAAGGVNAGSQPLTLNVTLPATGNYTVAIWPTGLDTGTVNLGVAHR